LAPHLEKYGWEPTIISVDPRDYESRLDQGLANMVPSNLRVIRSRALPAGLTRLFKIGDLGLRAFRGLLNTCSELLREEHFDVLFITIYPSYPAAIGPILKRKFRIPFVLDYQDPWVGAWGKTVGGGANGEPTLKNRLARAVAIRLERRVVRAADAITAVSGGTYEAVQERYPALRQVPCAAIPIGGETRDFEYLHANPRANAYFDPQDGQCHICYVGTLLPLGFETLRATLTAAALLRDRRPDLYARLQLHFFGTSNQTTVDAPRRALPIARELGIADRVTEVAPRIDYLDSLTVQTQATAILMLGSSERHYTASKLYPGLLARRPILAVYHESSTVVEVMRKSMRPPVGRLVTYDDVNRAEGRVEKIYAELLATVENPVYDPVAVNMSAVKDYSAESLAGELSAIFDQVKKNRMDDSAPKSLPGSI
jgi:glycosyltransferase involved in cell wall biosynthesis